MIKIRQELVENIRNHEDLGAAIKSSIKPLKPKDSEKITKNFYILNNKRIEYDPLRFIPQLLSDSFTVEDKLTNDTRSKYIWEQYDEDSDYYTVIKDKNLVKCLEVMYLRNKDLSFKLILCMLLLSIQFRVLQHIKVFCILKFHT